VIAAKSHASLEDEGLTCLGTFKEPGADKLEFTSNGTLAEHGWLMNWMSHEICGVGLENFRMAIHVQPVVNRLRGNGLRWNRTLSSPPPGGAVDLGHDQHRSVVGADGRPSKRGAPIRRREPSQVRADDFGRSAVSGSDSIDLR
jgi:hypothetical protein